MAELSLDRSAGFLFPPHKAAKHPFQPKGIQARSVRQRIANGAYYEEVFCFANAPLPVFGFN